MRAVRMLVRAIKLPARERRQAMIAAGTLGYASLALKLLPFRKAIKIGTVPLSSNGDRNECLVNETIQAVKRASYAVPWRSVCIHEGLATQLLLRRRGVPAVLYYGAAKLDGKLQAHVWVKFGDEIIIGGEEAPRFHCLASYPSSEQGARQVILPAIPL